MDVKIKDTLKEQPNFRKLPKRDGPTPWNKVFVEFYDMVGEHSGRIQMTLRDAIQTIRKAMNETTSAGPEYVELILCNTQGPRDVDVASYIIYVSPFYKCLAGQLLKDFCIEDEYYEALLACADTRTPQLIKYDQTK